MDTPKPIGYWLKHLHGLLERHFDATLGDLGMSRRQWQVLNTLGRGAATRPELATALAPFWDGEGPDLATTLAELADRGLVTGGPELALTPAGRGAHAEAAERVDATRATVLRGLTPEQYGETVRVLSVMAANVGADLDARRG
ncbi:MarR family transcriptional regulator [Streptomyces sp. NPDC051940]|uniref:MarR family winged helix-turn-helix transcriptional regulator n=1 Tax=Streptomyces sp. NPDC051940 TaxID=3155675 RepID=UPI0034382EEF